MPLYKIKAPDGQTYEIQGPANASQQQVEDEVLRQFPMAGRTTQELEATKSAPSSIKDIGLGGLGALAGGVQTLTNLAGVDNPVSKGLGSIQQYTQENLTPARQQELAIQGELENRAQGTGLGNEVSTGIRRFTQAPVQGTVNALLGSAPIIAAGFIPGGQVAAGASLGARVLAGARGATGIGGLMGVGGQKGQDYEAVKEALLAKGLDPVIAEQRAQEAAAYSLQNAPRQLLAGGAGAMEGAFGVEQALANAAKKVSKSTGATALDAPTFKRAVGTSVLGEGVPEAIQAGVGQIGTNVALNQSGISTDLTEGLAGTVAHDALVGSVLGLAVSPVQMSNLQREYKQSQANEQARKQAETDAKLQADAQKAAAERAVLQKQTDEIRQQMEQQQAIALPAPSEEIPVEEVQIDPLKNPLGNIRKNEVPFDIYKQIDEYRKGAGLPRLKEYSIEDFVDAMPGVNPKAEQGLLDELITAKSGYAGEKYTADIILEQALRKKIDTKTKGFQDFLARTTGVNALEKMSQPQLHAAFKALVSLPEATETTILPEGTNARRFDEKQYDKAIKGVDFLLAELGVPVDPKEVIKTIKEYTNLTEDSHAGAILDTAIKNGDVDLIKTPRYEIYDPKTGNVLPSTYTSRTAARAAAAKRGLNVRQITVDAISAPSTSVTLPEGFDIREGAFKEGEAPAGYEIAAGEEVLFKTNTVEEANAKKTSFERTRAGMAASRANQITQLNNSIETGQKRLNTMEAQGKGQTTQYQKAAGKHAKVVADTQAKIAALTEEIKKFDPKVTPLAVKPTGNKAVGRKGYTVFEQGRARATYPSRQAAEEGILADMDEKQLQELTQQQGRRAVGKKAQAELERRTAPKPTEGKPVSKVLEDIEVEKVKAAEAKETPGLKEKMAAVEAQLKPILKKFGLGDVNLNLVEKMDSEGLYNESLIKIALEEKEPVRVLRHESLHALKDLNFFTPQQWSALERMAKDQWIDKYLKKKATDYKGKPMSRYDAYVDLYNGDMAKVTEEAIADAFADFANNKAPAGMLAALLKRLNDFFTALRNALNSAGFQTYEDVFGKIERGELKAGQAQGGTERLSVKEYQKEQKQAEAYADANGIMPYVSEPIDELPTDSPRYSLQSYNPDKHLSFDPTLGVPINKDGTVTVYYHTTKENALRIAQNRMIPSDGRALIFLTNESGGDSILKNRGNFDQDLDGSTVLVYVTPDQLQVDEEYDNGRRDFFIPLAEGDYFANKMKLQSIQKSRKAPITDDFSYGDHEERITKAVNDYKAATPAERRKLVSTARKLLKKEHNVGSLLTENGKLEKTRIGDYNISYDGYSVASQGLGLASAQNITDKVNTCPRSAICEGLCLGETSGGNFMFGGAAKEDVDNIEKSAFRAGARMMQYLKTEALIVNPEAFATLLQGEIDSLAKWCASPTQIKVDPETKKRLNVEKEFYAPAIRLNVTSDFKPTMFRGLIESNPEVMFYDYTKLGSESIADNHHLTYSSTGFGQMVDGKKVFFKDKSGKYDHNWATMRSRLNAGQNVAMAFSSKSGLPKFLADAETGVEFQVLDGDDYDARFLDEKSAVKESSGGKGVIVGLRNKAGNMSEKNATVKTEGFFVQYDPKTDGDTIVVPNQLPFKLAKAEPKPAAPSTERLSLRAAPKTKSFKQWAGDNPIIPASDTSQYKGGSAVFQAFHGSTYNDITAFDTERGNEEGSLGAGSYFSTSSRDASTNYAGIGPDLDIRIKTMSSNLKDQFLDDYESSKEMLQEYLDDNKFKVNVEDLDPDRPSFYPESPSRYFEKASDYLATKYLKGGSDGLVMPVYVKLEKPFDMTSKRIELMYDEATEESPDDDLNRFAETVRDNANQWGIDPEYYLTAVYDAALDGVTAKELWDMSISRIEAWQNPYTGEPSSPSQFMQQVLKELGYDGIIQNASEVHGFMAGVENSRSPAANRTFHIMPFTSRQVKSITGNVGAFSQRAPTRAEAKRMGMTKEQALNAQARGDVRFSLRPFDPKELPQNKKEYTLPANTVLYHGAHEARAKDIEKAGKTLISRSPIKTSGGAMDEGGLIYFGSQDTAQRYATKGDAGATRFAEERGEKRKPGQVFQTITDRPYRLMNKNYVLTQKEADALNEVFGIPDYKTLSKGETANTAAYRAITNSRTVDRYKTDLGEMVVAWPKIFDTLGYDGFYDEFAVVLPADTGIRLVGKEGKMERFSLREVDDFFNKADGIKEPEGVEIIRENWIGSVSGLGDRDSAYDLYRVQGGKKYMDDVQNLVRDELGESFKGYRLMSVEELEEIKAGAMGSQLASFTLRPDIAHAFANLASYRKVPKDQLRVVEMDLTPEHVVMIGHPGERELVVDYGQGYNLDAVVEASVNARMSLRAAPETKEFKQWFSGSKVVDADGNPLVVYHGTNKDFVEFNPYADKKTQGGESLRGTNAMFFSDNPELASAYAGVAKSVLTNQSFAYPQESAYGGNVMPVYLSMQNPMVVDAKGQLYNKVEPLIREAKKKGHDGVIFKNVRDQPGAAGSLQTLAHDAYVVFKSTQIKSATGNIGSYDQYNPDIRYSLRDSTDPATLTRVNQTTTAREEKGYVERITKALGGDTFSELRARSLNRYNRLSDVDKAVVKQRKELGGAVLMADESAEAGALQSDLAAGVTASVLGVHDRNGGIPIYVNGVTKAFNDGGKIKGPVAIFAPLSKYNDPLIYQLYQFWAGVKRGSRLNAQGKPDIFTKDDVKRAEALEAKHPEFDQIQKEWTVFNNGLVQYLVDTGVLSEGDKARFTEFSDYIPFYRQMEGEKTIGPNLFQSISGVKKPRKLSEGTDKAPLADFLETVVRNTQSSIQMGMKNVAAQRALDRAMEIDMAERLRPNAPTGLDTVQVLEKGNVVTYQVADHLFIDAVKSLNMPDLPFIGLLSGPANFLRSMVTKDPGFMLANMVRDSMAAYVTSGVKMTPIADTVSNFGKAIAGTSPEFEALLNAGIGGGYEFSQNIEMSGKAFQKELNKKYEGKTLFQRMLNPMTAPTSLWEALEKGTTASDMATRIEVYKRTLAETNNEAEALHRALEVMNFNRKGSSAVIRILTAAIPFLNARMQGLDVLYRASFGEMNNKDAAMIQKRFIVRGLTMAALSAMYWTLTHDDDEYKKQEQETKDNNWLVPSLGIKIPIPFEIGVIFKVIPERIMALTLGQDTNKDFMDSMARNLRSTLAIDYLPQAIKPFVETETNFSLFTRRAIVGQGLEGVAPEYQIGPGTSSLAAFAGSNLGMSPMKIDHLIGGYTGTMGMYMVSALDGIMNMNAENPHASKRFEQLPFIKRFALDPEARGTVTGYYDLKNATDEVVRTSSLLERTMNFEERGKFMRENIRMLATKDYILDLEKTMKEFRQAQVMIRSSRMDADAKRDALLRINQAQNALTANIGFLRANSM